MVENQCHASGQRNRPKRWRQSEFWNKPNSAEGKEGGVNRDASADERLDMLGQPFKRSWIVAQHEPKIGAYRREADKGDPDHHGLSDQDALQSAICRGDEQHNLQRHVQPVAVLSMVAAIADTQPAIPRQIDGQDSEIEHHITKDTADQRRIVEPLMMNEFRMRGDGIDDRHRRHGDGAAACDQHHPDEGFAPSGVQLGPLFADNWDPKTDQAGRAKNDVKDDKGLKEMQI